MKSFFYLSKSAKTGITFMVLMAFLTAVFFGFLFMGHHQNEVTHGPSSCIAGVFEGSDCPATTTPLDFILFHFNALKIFSTALFSVLVLAAAVFVFAFFRWREQLLLLNLDPAPSANHNRHLRSLSFPYHAKIHRWLALHKKRDPFRS